MKLNIELPTDLLEKAQWWSKVVRAQKSENPEELTSLAEDEPLLREQILENPHTPPMVKVWVQSGRYGAMPLKEFLESACPTK
jgi:hypothetical protein